MPHGGGRGGGCPRGPGRVRPSFGLSFLRPWCARLVGAKVLLGTYALRNPPGD